MTYTYRKAKNAEKDAIFELYRLTMSGYISKIWGWNEQWQKNDFLSNFSPERITLACTPSELVAYMQTEYKNNSLFIRMLVVHPDHQRKGIGSKLLKSMIEFENDCSRGVNLEVFKINIKAKKFYENHSFIVKAETQNSYIMELRNRHSKKS